MSTANWITIVMALAGIVANLGWAMMTRFSRVQETMQNSLTGENGAVARLHGRIDALGTIYQSRKETEMQFDALKELMQVSEAARDARHNENVRRFDELKRSGHDENEKISAEVRSLRNLVNERIGAPQR